MDSTKKITFVGENEVRLWSIDLMFNSRIMGKAVDSSNLVHMLRTSSIIHPAPNGAYSGSYDPFFTFEIRRIV